jgi:uncharacterized protein YbjT (DUF2867 family)
MGVPVVGIVGGCGFVGSFLSTAFLEAKQEGRVKEVRLLTSKISDKSKEFEGQGANVVEVDYTRKESIVKGLRNVDVLISAMGTGPGTVDARRLLLEAMAMVGVDVYFPSEFGTNHYSPRYWNSTQNVESCLLFDCYYV